MSDKPRRITIAYCAECGYGQPALDLTRALMKTLGPKLPPVELLAIPDVFEVVVMGDLVHSMERDGGFPTDESMVEAVRERM